MTKKKPTQDGPEFFVDVFKSMQGAMVSNPLFAPQAGHFWQTQEHLLEAAEAYTRSWFERRHEATRTAMTAARKAATEDGGNAGEAMQSIAEWQRHSMERMVEDARDWLDMVTQCANYVSKAEVEAVEEVMDGAKKATKAAKSEPV